MAITASLKASSLLLVKWTSLGAATLPNGLEMSRPASQGQYRAKLNLRLAGSAPSNC